MRVTTNKITATSIDANEQVGSGIISFPDIDVKNVQQIAFYGKLSGSAETRNSIGLTMKVVDETGNSVDVFTNSLTCPKPNRNCILSDGDIILRYVPDANKIISTSKEKSTSFSDVSKLNSSQLWTLEMHISAKSREVVKSGDFAEIMFEVPVIEVITENIIEVTDNNPSPTQTEEIIEEDTIEGSYVIIGNNCIFNKDLDSGYGTLNECVDNLVEEVEQEIIEIVTTIESDEIAEENVNNQTILYVSLGLGVLLLLLGAVWVIRRR